MGDNPSGRCARSIRSDAAWRGTVPGTVANFAAPPPLVGGLRHPAGTVLSTNPYVAEVQNWIETGEATPEAWRTGNHPTGQAITKGPGGTDAAVATRATTPLGPGQVINTTGQPGGPTIGGGSTYAHAGDETSGTADVGLANTDLETGNAAQANLGKIGPLVDLYNSVIAPETTVGGKAATTVKEKLANYFGLPLDRFYDPAAAKALIKTQLLSFVGGLRDAAELPLPRRAIDLIVNQIPDPSVDPADSCFHELGESASAGAG